MSTIKEILCLHHSHLDIGYTHPQPLLLELQRDYIDEAIDLCLETEHMPEESRFRWTCEATLPVLKWLETAPPERIDQFRRLLQNGQMSIAAFPMHTTPLCNADQMARLLYPIRALRERFGIAVNTAINHDVNGQPWPMSQILLDAGIEFYITGINIHFGGIPFPRPAAFRWQTPDRRELLTFHGEHYSLFSQFFHTSERDTKLMDQGIREYVSRLEQNGYGYDFAFLTATNPPLFDNNCPDPELAALIKRYNEEGHEQVIRFVTPEMLLERVRSIPADQIPAHAGDWTDYWNFGSGSSARETRLTRRAKRGLKKAEFLEAAQGHPGLHYQRVKEEVILQSALYDEHTWGASHSITTPDHPEVLSQRTHKSKMAYQAADLSAYVLGKQMETLAGNPGQSTEPEGVVLVNASDVPQQVELHVPETYFMKGRHLAAARVKDFLPYGAEEQAVKRFGTIDIAPYSWRKIPFSALREQAGEEKQYTVSADAIETPFYRMTFDPQSGRIRQIYDKRRGWEMLDPHSEWTFFDYVRETIDPQFHEEHRSTFFPRDVDLGNRSISVWNHEWKAKRKGVERIVSFSIEQHADSVVYVMRSEAEGVKSLEQRITLSARHPRIGLSAVLDKEDIRTPESVYFAFPLQLDAGWRSHYDTAGMFVELDREQLGDVSRDWVTVDETVSIYDGRKGVTLACPDAPLVQIGGFNFGKESKRIERGANPLLLAWPMNNYWDTNFWASQPGCVHFYYELQPFGQFDPVEAYRLGVSAGNPVAMNVAVHCPEEESGEIIRTAGDGIAALYVKPAEDGNGTIVTLRNIGAAASEFSYAVPGRTVRRAALVNTLEEHVREAAVREGQAVVRLEPDEMMRLRVVSE